MWSSFGIFPSVSYDSSASSDPSGSCFQLLLLRRPPGPAGAGGATCRGADIRTGAQRHHTRVSSMTRPADVSQAEVSGVVTVPGVQLGAGKEKEAETPRGGKRITVTITMRDFVSQAEVSGAVTVPGVQLRSAKKKEAERPRGDAYNSLNDLRRIFGLPPIPIPSTMPDESDPTNDFEAVSLRSDVGIPCASQH